MVNGLAWKPLNPMLINVTVDMYPLNRYSILSARVNYVLL